MIKSEKHKIGNVENKQEIEKPNLLVRIARNHPFLSGLSVGALSAGIVGLTECGVKAGINYLGGDISQSPIITPHFLSLVELGFGCVYGLSQSHSYGGYGTDYHKDRALDFDLAVFAGVGVGSFLSGIGLNYLI